MLKHHNFSLPKTRHVLLYLCLFHIQTLLFGQSAKPIKDIAVLNLSDAATLNGYLYFGANNGVNGEELWKSDGTEKGTTMVADIVPGDRTRSSSPSAFYTYKNNVLFIARLDRVTYRLYKTDGTSAGTKQLGGAITAGATKFFEFNNKLYFFSGEDELWVLDDLLANASKVADIPGIVKNHTVMNGKLYFIVIGLRNHFLYSSDGSASGTKEIKRFPTFGTDGDIVTANNMVFFTADDGNNGTEVWTSNGTENGTKMLKNIAARAGSDPIAFMSDGSTVIFHADDRTEVAVTGGALWKTNGTEAGTTKVLNDEGQPFYINKKISVAGKKMFFLGGTKDYKNFTNKNTGIHMFNFDKNQYQKFPLSNSAYQFLDAPGDGLIYLLSYVSGKGSQIQTLDTQKETLKTIAEINDVFILFYSFNVVNKVWLGSQMNNINVPVYGLYATGMCSHTASINTSEGTSICAGSSVNISAEASGSTLPFTYKWKHGNLEVGNTQKLTVSKEGNYTLEVTDNAGCTVSSSVDITRATNLPVNIAGASFFCAGQSTTLVASTSGGTAPYTYQWKQGNAAIGTNSGSLNVNSAGSYSVTVTDSKGCTGTAGGMSISQKRSPDVTITKSGATDVLTGESVTLSVPQAANQTYQWLKDGVAIAGATRNTYITSGGGAFSVAVNFDGCTATSERISVNLILSTELTNKNNLTLVYPNPTTNQVQVVINVPIKKAARLNLLSTSGEVIKEWRITQQVSTLDLGSVPSGTYILRSNIDNNTDIKKIIKYD